MFTVRCLFDIQKERKSRDNHPLKVIPKCERKENREQREERALERRKKVTKLVHYNYRNLRSLKLYNLRLSSWRRYLKNVLSFAGMSLCTIFVIFCFIFQINFFLCQVNFSAVKEKNSTKSTY